MAKHYIKNIGISAITYANNISSGQTYEFFDDVTNTYGINSKNHTKGVRHWNWCLTPFV